MLSAIVQVLNVYENADTLVFVDCHDNIMRWVVYNGLQWGKKAENFLGLRLLPPKYKCCNCDTKYDDRTYFPLIMPTVFSHYKMNNC